MARSKPLRRKEIASKMGLGCGFHLFFEEEAPDLHKDTNSKYFFFQICCLVKLNRERERDECWFWIRLQRSEERSQEEYGFRKNKVTRNRDRSTATNSDGDKGDELRPVSVFFPCNLSSLSLSHLTSLCRCVSEVKRRGQIKTQSPPLD